MFTSFSTQVQRVKSKYFGYHSILLLLDSNGKVLDVIRGIGQGIRLASKWDILTFRAQKILLKGQVFFVRKKSLNQYLLRNLSHLSNLQYGFKLHLAMSVGFKNALRFIPKKGKKKAELAALMLLMSTYPKKEELNAKIKGQKPLSSHTWELLFVDLWSKSKEL